MLIVAKGGFMRFYPPFMILFLLLAFFALIFFFIMLQLHIITFAFEKLGFSAFAVFLILMGSLIGGAINIPIKELPCDVLHTDPVSYFGVRYNIPHYKAGCTLLAVNIGGAVIPSLVSVYLWMNGNSLATPIIATAIVAFVVHRLARPVRGLGIATPMFVPPLMALLAAFVLAPNDAPRVAYIAGTMGTLIGADLMNLKKIADLGAPVASIGGAGTFDAIFITGIIAVLLA